MCFDKSVWRLWWFKKEWDLKFFCAHAALIYPVWTGDRSVDYKQAVESYHKGYDSFE